MGAVVYLAGLSALALTGLISQNPSNSDTVKLELKAVRRTDNTEPQIEQLFRAVVIPDSVVIRSIEFFRGDKRVCTVKIAPYECSINLGSNKEAALIHAIATLADDSEVVGTESTGLSDETGVSRVLVPVGVKDSKDQFVKGLQESSFRLLEDNVPQTVSLVNVDRVPLDIVLAVDISESMAPSMPKLKTAVKRFLDGLTTSRTKDSDIVNLVEFNDRIVVDRTPGGIRSTVDSLEASGGTALYDALLTSLDQLGKGFAHKAVIVFSDGDDRNSLASKESVLQKIRQSEATIYMIVQEGDVQVRNAKKIAEEIAKASGGRSSVISKIDQLDKMLHQIVEDLANQYLLSYTSTNAARDGGYRRISVTIANSKHHLQFREGYRAPSK